MNILAIDYGEKFVGLALSPSDARVAVPFGTLRRVDDAQLINEVMAILKKERIGIVVVGMPFTLKDTESSQTKRTKVFVEHLTTTVENDAQLACAVQTFPETLTSKEASERPHGAGASVHERSAMILLEDWLEMHPQ